jgi:hypothetical protein
VLRFHSLSLLELLLLRLPVVDDLSPVACRELWDDKGQIQTE